MNKMITTYKFKFSALTNHDLYLLSTLKLNLNCCEMDTISYLFYVGKEMQPEVYNKISDSLPQDEYELAIFKIAAKIIIKDF